MVKNNDELQRLSAAILRETAHDGRLLEIARKAIEDELIEWRDSRLFQLRNNGFVCKEKDGSESSIIRFGPEIGVRIALLAIAKYMERSNNSEESGSEERVST